MLVPYSRASFTWNVACTQYRQLHGLCQRTAYAYSLSGNALAEDSRVFVDEQVLDRRLVVLAGRGTREGPTASCRHDLDWCLRWCKGGAGDTPAETSDCPARANMRAGEMGGGGKDGQAGSSWCVEPDSFPSSVGGARLHPTEIRREEGETRYSVRIW